jgi:hypothetical protein
MAREYLMAGFLATLWLASVICCFFALVGAYRNVATRFWRAGLPALVAVGIGVVGVWAPFSWWPQVSYSFSLGGVQRSIDFSWPFAAPLILGGLTLLFLIWKRCQRPAVERGAREV